MVDTEDYFPRGGKKPAAAYFKQSGNFLGASKKHEKKKKKPRSKLEEDDGYLSDEELNRMYNATKETIVSVSYKSIKAGVLILGRVQYALETRLVVMLPGRMIGNVMACHISEPYNKLLEAYVNDQTDKVKELPQMFQAGQYVAVKVLEVDGKNLMLSIMPQHVNAGAKPTDVRKGTVLQAAVSSVEDHGYLLDVGIPNCKMFLPKEEAHSENELDVGAVVWAAVQSAAQGVARASCRPAALRAAAPAAHPATPLLPATALRFTLDEAVEGGLRGSVAGGRAAYVVRGRAGEREGPARLLYCMPTSGAALLSTRDVFRRVPPDLAREQTLQPGDVVEDAQVVRVSRRAVHFRLRADCVGTLSLKRVQHHEDLSDEELVASSYPIGSRHRVRVLCYHLADYEYAVTDAPGALAERYFTARDLAPGDLVDGVVHEHRDGRLLVRVGRLQGLVPATHVTETALCGAAGPGPAAAGARHKFKGGQAVRARVLSVPPPEQALATRHALYLTLKPSLLAEELPLLLQYTEDALGNTYTGVVKYVAEFLIVSFFNGVCAYVSRRHAAAAPPPRLADAFRPGQTVRCTILRVDVPARRMWGSLRPAPAGAVKRKFDSRETAKINKKQRLLNAEPGADDKKNRKKRIDQEKHSDISENSDVDRDSADNENCEKIECKKIQQKKIKRKGEDNIKNNKNSKEPLVTDVDEEINIKKKKAKRKAIEEDVEENEISDAADIGFNENGNQLLSSQETVLTDLTACLTGKSYKKRVVSLLKAIRARSRRVHVLDKKIARAHQQGLTAKNKDIVTAIHTEKLLVEERIKKLSEALQVAQEKLKELGIDEIKEIKKKKIHEVEVKEETEKVQEDVKKTSKIAFGSKSSIEKSKEQAEVKEEKQENCVKESCKGIETLVGSAPGLAVPSAKLFWSGTPVGLARRARAPSPPSSPSSDDEQQTEEPKKKRKKLSVSEKLARARQQEERVRAMERAAAESGAHPRSSEQFERALLAHPDTSQLWIAYMAFHLQATEVEKARAVARRALATISFREEDEKLNVWLALLGLETRFGSDEARQQTLADALRANEPYRVHEHLLRLYAETGNARELAPLVELMLRRYRGEPAAYVACGRACFALGLRDKARRVMQRALAALANKQHVAVLTQFAALERGAGGDGPERAAALLDRLLATYPQRTDLVALYVDMLAKDGDAHRIRQVMERATAQRLPARKAQALYRKWLEAEQRLGHAGRAETVRRRALEYAEKANV